MNGCGIPNNILYIALPFEEKSKNGVRKLIVIEVVVSEIVKDYQFFYYCEISDIFTGPT